MFSPKKEKFLLRIEKIAKDHGEIYDTAVRESIAYYIKYILLKNKPIDLTFDFQMYTIKANKRVIRCVNSFVKWLLKETNGLSEEKKKAFCKLHVPDDYWW